jgi:hypothetical protein
MFKCSGVVKDMFLSSLLKVLFVLENCFVWLLSHESELFKLIVLLHRLLVYMHLMSIVVRMFDINLIVKIEREWELT